MLSREAACTTTHAAVYSHIICRFRCFPAGLFIRSVLGYIGTWRGSVRDFLFIRSLTMAFLFSCDDIDWKLIMDDKPIITSDARFVEVQNLVAKSGNPFCIATFHVQDVGAIKCFLSPELSPEVQRLAFGCPVRLGFALRVDSRLTLGLALVSLDVAA